MNWKPNVLIAIVSLLLIALVTLLAVPEYAELICSPCVMGIGTLGMKLLEK